MKESNVFASNAATNQPQMYSISTGHFMKELSIHAGNATIEQLHRKVLLNT